MADSNVTKKVLAAAFEELLVTKPFAKVSIGDICKQCNMSRKSFYYHFKDKDDLVNWIFETEFVSCSRQNTYDSVWSAIEDLLQYFYRKRFFYKKVLKHEGQNSFSEYFNDLLHDVFTDQWKTIIRNPYVRDFQIDFIADGMVCMLKRWLDAPECPAPEKFMGEIKLGARLMAEYISGTLCGEAPHSGVEP